MGNVSTMEKKWVEGRIHHHEYVTWPTENPTVADLHIVASIAYPECDGADISVYAQMHECEPGQFKPCVALCKRELSSTTWREHSGMTVTSIHPSTEMTLRDVDNAMAQAYPALALDAIVVLAVKPMYHMYLHFTPRQEGVATREPTGKI